MVGAWFRSSLCPLCSFGVAVAFPIVISSYTSDFSLILLTFILVFGVALFLVVKLARFLGELLVISVLNSLVV